MSNLNYLAMEKLLNEMELNVINRNSGEVNIMVTVFAGHNVETKNNLGISGLIEAILLSRGQGMVTASYGGTARGACAPLSEDSCVRELTGSRS